MTGKILVALLIGGLLQGCGSHDAEHHGQAHGEHQGRADPGATDATVDAQAPGKSQAPISLAWEMLGQPKRDEPLEIRLDVGLTQGRTGSVVLELSSDEGLVFSGSTVKRHRIDIQGDAEPVLIEVVPQSDGLAYVHVVARLDVAGSVGARALSIPVTTGEVAERSATMNQAGSIETDADGQPLHVMPAETVDDHDG